MTIPSLSKYLGMEEEALVDFLKVNTKRVLVCLLEFAETFTKNSYFQHYSLFYTDYNKFLPLVEYDFLFLRMASCALGQASLNCDLVLHELFQERK